jgi:hypothetical protein
LLTDRDEMSSLYRGTSIDASYQVSVHLAKRFLSILDFELIEGVAKTLCLSSKEV